MPVISIGDATVYLFDQGSLPAALKRRVADHLREAKNEARSRPRCRCFLASTIVTSGATQVGHGRGRGQDEVALADQTTRQVNVESDAGLDQESGPDVCSRQASRIGATMNSLRALSLRGNSKTPSFERRPANQAGTGVGPRSGKSSAVWTSRPRSTVTDRIEQATCIGHRRPPVVDQRRVVVRLCDCHDDPAPRDWSQLGSIRSGFIVLMPSGLVPSSQRASRPAGRSGLDQAPRLAEVFEDPFGGQIAAPDGPFHRGRPAGRRPVAGEEQSLRRASAGSAGSRRSLGRTANVAPCSVTTHHRVQLRVLRLGPDRREGRPARLRGSRSCLSGKRS